MRTGDRRLTNLVMAGLMGVVLLTGLAGGILLGRGVLAPTGTSVDVPSAAADEFRLIAEGWRTIERQYVNREELEPRGMAYGGLTGIVQTLGDAGHTRFLSPEIAEQHARQIQGEFEGIGAYVEMKDGRAVIVAPIDDSPAQRAGLEPGDVILEVDGEDVSGRPLDEVVSRVLGPAGTEVALTILDPDTGETRELTIERAAIELDLVTWHDIPGTSLAYVRISAFSDGATDELDDVLAEIEEQGISGLMLDLRSNPGGLLREAIGTTSRFLEEGEVVRRRDAEGNVKVEPVRRGVDATDIPMVTIANGGTASAAEIVTGALQDHERAVVVGETTFGAGTVLNEFGLADGSVLLLATEEWLTPDGRTIWQQGLPPDIRVPLPVDAQPILRPGQEDISESDLSTTTDEQFLRALDLLRQRSSSSPAMRILRSIFASPWTAG